MASEKDEYVTWRESLEFIRRNVKRRLFLDSDSSGAFDKIISDFKSWLFTDDKEKDPDVLKLFHLSRRVANSREELINKQVEIIDLCIHICDKFLKQPAAQ